MDLILILISEAAVAEDTVALVKLLQEGAAYAEPAWARPTESFSRHAVWDGPFTAGRQQREYGR